MTEAADRDILNRLVRLREEIRVEVTMEYDSLPAWMVSGSLFANEHEMLRFVRITEEASRRFTLRAKDVIHDMA